MFKKNPTSVRLTLRALGYLLSYPDAQLRSVMPQLIDALQAEQALTAERMDELKAVCQHLAALDPLEAEARYVDNFDRGRQTSLHLFEHVHGDSRDRGPALIDLMQTYEKAGLQFEADELPGFDLVEQVLHGAAEAVGNLPEHQRRPARKIQRCEEAELLGGHGVRAFLRRARPAASAAWPPPADEREPAMPFRPPILSAE